MCIDINLLFFYAGSRINPARLKSFLRLHLTDCVAFTGEDNLSLSQFAHLNSYISIGILYIKSDDLHKLLRIVFGIQEPLRLLSLIPFCYQNEIFFYTNFHI